MRELENTEVLHAPYVLKMKGQSTKREATATGTSGGREEVVVLGRGVSVLNKKRQHFLQ